MAQKAAGASPAMTASTAAQAAPAPRKRGLAGVRVQDRIGIDPDIALLGHRTENAAGVARRMNALDLLQARQRRLAPGEPSYRRLVDRAQDRLEPDRRFGMARPGIVLEGHRMSVEQ